MSAIDTLKGHLKEGWIIIDPTKYPEDVTGQLMKMGFKVVEIQQEFYDLK